MGTCTKGRDGGKQSDRKRSEAEEEVQRIRRETE
jgi:hypothetical protein